MIAGCIVAFHLGNAFIGKSFIRASHLGAALQYAKGSINLMHPVIVGFDAKGTPAALEFPLWQAAAGLVFKITKSTWFGWANLVSLALFFTSVWPFLKLATHHVGRRAAWWSLAFLLAQPLIIVMAGEAATDGFCLAVTLWFLYFADKMLRTHNGCHWFPTAIFASISAVSKLPFFMASGLCVLVMLAIGAYGPTDSNSSAHVDSRLSWKPWVLLAGAGLVAATCLAGWTIHASALASQAEYPYVDLRMSQSPFLRFWYFGDLHYRLSPGPWLKGAWRFLHATVGALPMALLLVLGFLSPGSRLGKCWLFAAFLTTLVFTHLILAHWHYYLMCCPAVALLCGLSVVQFENRFFTKEGQTTGGATSSTPPAPGFLSSSAWLGLAGVTLGFSAIDGLMAMRIAIDYDYFPKMISAQIREHTGPADKLIIYTCDPDWGGEPLFRSGRSGLSVMNFENSPDMPTVKGLRALLTNNADVRHLKELGYNKLVLVSESPVRFAVEASNPGSKRQRRFYPEIISPSVDSWPAVYRSQDLLIKDIP
jgi:hypothetical protein